MYVEIGFFCFTSGRTESLRWQFCLHHLYAGREYVKRNGCYRLPDYRIPHVICFHALLPRYSPTTRTWANRLVKCRRKTTIRMSRHALTNQQRSSRYARNSYDCFFIKWESRLCFFPRFLPRSKYFHAKYLYAKL